MNRCALLSIVFCFALSGCRGPVDPVAKTIEHAVEATEERDTRQLHQLLSTGYHDAIHATPDEAINEIRRYLAAYDHFDIRLSDLKTSAGSGAAAARFRLNFVGTPRAFGGLDAILPRASIYDFEVKLVENRGRWRIESAEWQRVETPLAGQ